MSNNLTEILNMVKEGKISPEDGEKLIHALHNSHLVQLDQDRTIELMPEDYENVPPGTEETSKVLSGKKARFLVIQVVKDGSKTVNVKVPIKLAKMVSNFIPKHVQGSMKAGGIDADLGDILSGIEQMPPGEDIINVVDEDDDECVRIYTT